MKSLEISEVVAAQLELHLKAFQNIYGKEFTMDRMLESLLSGSEEIHPEIVDELSKMM